MSKSYKEQRQYKNFDYSENDSTKAKPNKYKNKKEKLIHNALRSKNILDIIKYSEED